MNTFSGLELRELQLSLPFVRKKRDELLQRCGLASEDADFAVGIFDSDDRMVATASLAGDVIKGVAADESVRSESLSSTLVSAIISYASQTGVSNLKVFTKPEYEDVFRAMAFHPVGRCESAALLEQDGRLLRSYKEYLEMIPRKGRVGCVVMNANPMTLGHCYLIEEASRQVDTLFVISVADDVSTQFSYAERIAILRDATSAFHNVTVVEGSHYAISRSTFPSYFIKEVSEVTSAHIELDLDIFARHIAPSLGVDVRFVGSEPTDELTAAYNEGMQRILPSQGIEVCVIDRISEAGGDACGGITGNVISASRVRSLLNEGRVGEAFRLVPKSTLPYLLGHAAAWALKGELDLTPKPGLVDRDNSGSHNDMDYDLMTDSIVSLVPAFTMLAALSIGPDMPSASLIKAVGIESERRMMEATGGVNTHRGALFSLGLAVVASARLLGRGEVLTTAAIQELIKTTAEGFPRPEGTHGASVSARYGVPTALDAARAGYPEAFGVIGEQNRHRMLLRLMSVMDDSNVYHRCGPEVAAEVKAKAAETLSLHDCGLDGALREMDADFISRRISPGGAADMLALALFLRSVASDERIE